MDSLCNTGERKDIKVGDRVIVYPEGDDDLEELQDGSACLVMQKCILQCKNMSWQLQAIQYLSAMWSI